MSSLLAGFVISVVLLRYYQYNERKIAQQHAARMQQLQTCQKPLSGVIIEEREVALPFPFFKELINSLLPYHVSLQFPQSSENEKQRHVGLGPIENKVLFNGFFRQLMTHWRSHVGPAYQQVKPGKMTPVEAWPTFFRYFGYFPEAVDVKTLGELTRTPEEGGQLQGCFFALMPMPQSRLPRFVNCETKALAAIHDAMTKP